MAKCLVEKCELQSRVRGYCEAHNGQMKRMGKITHEFIRDPEICVVDWCNDEVYNISNKLCKAHFNQLHRHGKIRQPNEYRAAAGFGCLHNNGYFYVHDKSHPLAGARGRLSLHRKILYNKIGPGIHQCNWCDKLISWEDKTLFPDHLDWDRLNNHPDNLVPSCVKCNISRKKSVKNEVQ